MNALFKISLLGFLALQFTAQSHSAPYLDRDYEIAESLSAETMVIDDEAPEGWNESISGKILNSLNKPVPRAAIVYEGVEYFADDQGEFNINRRKGGDTNLLIKKAGYRRVSVAPTSRALSINLEPIEIKSTYMQVGQLKGGMKNSVYASQIKLLEETELNAITIDYKDDSGRIAEGLKPHLDLLRAKNVYLIARVVAFKDRYGKDAKIQKDRMLQNKNGGLWLDKHGVAYLDPYNNDAHDYLISVSKQAVLDGFDEIQFDYVRFPTDGDRTALKLPAVHTSDSRSAAISGFLKKARKAIGSLGAFVAADVFGDTAFVKGDSGIGQNIEAISMHLDYVCPMVYPSGYNKGYNGVKDPVAQPKDIVALSVKRYRIRSEKVNKDLIIRPWLQSFKDYSGSGRNYGEWEIAQQIEGSNQEGGQGFLLWNASGKFSKAGLKPKKKSNNGPY